MRAAGDRIGLTTVYRTLRALADSGDVDVIAAPDGRSAFRVCGNGGHHHHLICRSCGRTNDVPGLDLEHWAAAASLQHGFTEVSHIADIFGTCPDCALLALSARTARRLSAGSADAEHIEAVAVRLEALGVGEPADGGGCLVLEQGRKGHVNDLAAVDAQQVMVVLGEFLGQLEAGELVVGGDPPDEPCGVQIDQVPVRRAAWQVREPLGNVADADGMAGADKQVDNRPPPGGVALIDPAQPALDLAVHVAGHLLS